MYVCICVCVRRYTCVCACVYLYFMVDLKRKCILDNINLETILRVYHIHTRVWKLNLLDRRIQNALSLFEYDIIVTLALTVLAVFKSLFPKCLCNIS